MFDCYDTLITPEEVADMLGCGMNTTYKLLKSGKIKAMRMERGLRQRHLAELLGTDMPMLYKNPT